MKTCVSIIFLLSVQFVIAQTKATNYGSIDKHVANIDASSPKELEQELTTPYQTDLEKIRAFFSWIAQHISYDCASDKLRTKNSKSSVTGEVNYDVDTSSELTPLNQLVAEDVMRKRMAFCYGYARLFKCLCDYASIPCEIINGYARGDLNKVGNNFRTNHSWNAVKLDSNWYLVDVTWASGYFTYNSNEFIKHFDNHFFLPPPEQFPLDPFPDDLVCLLLQHPPAIKEFQHSP